MSDLDVKIVKLGPIRVASFHAYGAGPENDAGNKLVAWAKPRGFLDTPGEHRVFGFDNPVPSPGSPNYGYEYWITVGPDIGSEDGVDIREFPGGLYAVARCEVKGNPHDIIPATWMRLAAWLKGSNRYNHDANREGLEEHIGPFPFDVSDDFTLDLYLPIRE